MGDRHLYLGLGVTFGILLAGFFLAGGHQEVRDRIKQRRYGGGW